MFNRTKNGSTSGNGKRSNRNENNSLKNSTSNTTLNGLKMPDRVLLGSDSRITSLYANVLSNNHRKIWPIGSSNMVYAAWTGRCDLMEGILNGANIRCDQLQLSNVRAIAKMICELVTNSANFEEGVGVVLGGILPGDNFVPQLFKIEKQSDNNNCTFTSEYNVKLGSGSRHLPDIEEKDLIALSDQSSPNIDTHMLMHLHEAAKKDWGGR